MIDELPLLEAVVKGLDGQARCTAWNMKNLRDFPTLLQYRRQKTFSPVHKQASVMGKSPGVDPRRITKEDDFDVDSTFPNHVSSTSSMDNKASFAQTQGFLS
jgi:hypothetical protein